MKITGMARFASGILRAGGGDDRGIGWETYLEHAAAMGYCRELAEELVRAGLSTEGALGVMASGGLLPGAAGGWPGRDAGFSFGDSTLARRVLLPLNPGDSMDTLLEQVAAAARTGGYSMADVAYGLRRLADDSR
jgi:hypothetical protein